MPKKLKVNDIKSNVERVLFALKTNKGLNISDKTRDEIKFVTKKFVNDGQRLCSDRRNMALHCTLYSLSKDLEIKVCKFDKGRVVVLLDSDDYYSKLDYIVNDQSKFHQICVNTKVHPVIVKENSIAYHVCKHLKNLGTDTLRKLIRSGSNPGKIYGLVKVHKRGNPVRPVVLMIGTPKYQLAKFLDSIIKPYIPQTYATIN